MCVADVYRTAHWERNTVWDGRSGQVPLSHCVGTARLWSSVLCIKEVSDHCTNCFVSIFVSACTIILLFLFVKISMEFCESKTIGYWYTCHSLVLRVSVLVCIMFVGSFWPVSTPSMTSITSLSMQFHCWLFWYRSCRSSIACDCSVSTLTDWDVWQTGW